MIELSNKIKFDHLKQRTIITAPRNYRFVTNNFNHIKNITIHSSVYCPDDLITIYSFKRIYYLDPRDLSVWIPDFFMTKVYKTKHKLKLKEVKNVNAPTKEI